MYEKALQKRPGETNNTEKIFMYRLNDALTKIIL